ncbi:MAG: hypothetical protein JSU77_11320 [Fidelibacterota bacterium]|nr:MAG: hypothetical protein JSU77_11320 [Candidatus Neomarinimicrobiota bacterium]
MRRSMILMVALTALCWGQLVPTQFSLHKIVVDSTASYMVDSTSFAGLASNSILDIRATGDSLLFFGTSRGLSLTPDLGTTFRSYMVDKVNLPEGGISALAVEGDTITVAGMKDTVVAGSGKVMGTGIAFSTDVGDIWTCKDQPADESGDTTFLWVGNTVRQLAVTTSISNVTYDVAVSQGNIWTASWAGGLRRYDLDLPAGRWTPVPLPRDNDTTFSCSEIPEDYVLNPRDPGDGGNHNHKAFSVVAYDSLVWVGTAAGINKGIFNAATGCITWTHYKAQWGGRPISGNWVVALHRQVTADGKERIWAATVETDQSERRAVSFTEDGGETWYITLLGERAHNITSAGDAVFVATDNGLYKSFDGLNWARFHSAVDSLTGEQVWAEEAYGVLFDSRDSTLWIGTPDGLARTRDAGLSWEIERSFISTSDSGEVRFYAYPNPFYPAENNVLSGSGHVRFQYYINAGEIGTTTTARISIFDFAMDPVISLATRYHTGTGDFSQAWDGHNDAGHQVANGVYYCRLTLGGSEYWTKVMVIK